MLADCFSEEVLGSSALRKCKSHCLRDKDSELDSRITHRLAWSQPPGSGGVIILKRTGEETAHDTPSVRPTWLIFQSFFLRTNFPNCKIHLFQKCNSQFLVNLQNRESITPSSLRILPPSQNGSVCALKSLQAPCPYPRQPHKSSITTDLPTLVFSYKFVSFCTFHSA